MSEEAPDRYTSLEPHDTWFDWSDASLDADAISARLMGPVAYWDTAEFAGLDPLYIERDLLFQAGRNNWGGKSRFGKCYYQHLLILIRLMFPNTDITPSLADVTRLFALIISDESKKIENVIGAQNTGKSAGSVRLMFACMFIDPEYSVGYVANPFDNASDSTVWGDVEELWDELCETHPNADPQARREAPSLFPRGRKYAARKLEFVPGLPKAGYIELRNVKHVGKYKGSKSRGKDTTRGIFFLAIDEVNEIDNYAFLSTLTNISSLPGFIAMTSQNFKDEQDMGGRLTEPQAREGGPQSFDDLDLEGDLIWYSKSSSITIRLDGHRSPNILAGRVIYPKLFKASDRDRLANDYGTESPEYFQQVRSFPLRNTEANSVLSLAKISASRYDDAFYTLKTIRGRSAFCDPAFGGRDSAVIGFGSFGDAVVTDADGAQFPQELLVFTDYFQTLKLSKDATYAGAWLDRLKRLSIPTSTFTMGAIISYEDQIAIQCLEFCRKNGVPEKCFGYDFSMRPDIVSSINKFFGFSAAAFDYNQPPEGLFIQNTKENAADCCKNRCTEMAFVAADLYLTKQIRGAQYIQPATTQLSRTRYEKKNGKYIVEGKKEYKARWQQASPDYRDVLMGITVMAHRSGFRKRLAPTKPEDDLWSTIDKLGLGKAKVAKRF